MNNSHTSKFEITKLFNKYRSHLLFILFSLFIMSDAMTQENNSGNLIIEIDGIRNHKGKIRLSIYGSENGFPGKPESAVQLVEGNISKNTSRIVVRSIPFGEYAISLIHDENLNGKLDTKFFGIPKEGIGMSNDARGTFGPPSFKQAKFQFSKNDQVEKIKMVYY